MPVLREDEARDDLRKALRETLAERCSTTSVLDHIASRQGYDRDLWRVISDEMGLTAMLVPEKFGGHGATVRDAAAVMEELGRAVAPVPFLASAVLATNVVHAAATAGSDAAPELLARLAAGAIACLTVPATSSPFAPVDVTVRADGNGALTGRVTNVLAADCADLFVVPAVGPAGILLFAVESEAAGLTIIRRTCLDETQPVSDVGLAGVRAIALAHNESAPTMLSVALQIAAVMQASEAVGIADWALDEATSYLKVRKQFGRPIGSYQALRHRAAHMWITNNQGRAIVRYAIACHADSLEDRMIALAMAQAYSVPNALAVNEACLQLHGGIGFTWESGVHLHLKRALANTVQFGTSAVALSALGNAINIEAPPDALGQRGERSAGHDLAAPRRRIESR